MSENETAVEELVEGTAVVKPSAEIIRGRMPAQIVAMIKFEADTETDGALAKKYRTTNGKVSDIRKGRNFEYITADFKPSAEQIEAAKIYAAQCTDKSILATVNALVPCSTEEAATFVAARQSVRTPKAPTVEDEVPAKKKGGKKKNTTVVEAPAAPANDDIESLLD